jgi:anti-anti-sigma factor
VHTAGELDHHTSDCLIDTVTAHLETRRTPPRDVRLDFAALTYIDSSGLSALLMIHRRVGALGATLHLDNRPDFLQRMLDLTHVLDHLTAPPHRGTPAEGGGLAEAGLT